MKEYWPLIALFVSFQIAQLVINTKTALLARMAIKKVESLEKALNKHIIGHGRRWG